MQSFATVWLLLACELDGGEKVESSIQVSRSLFPLHPDYLADRFFIVEEAGIICSGYLGSKVQMQSEGRKRLQVHPNSIPDAIYPPWFVKP